MSYTLNSLKGNYIGEYRATTVGVTKGDTRSLDCNSYGDSAAYASASTTSRSLLSLMVKGCQLEQILLPKNDIEMLMSRTRSLPRIVKCYTAQKHFVAEGTLCMQSFQAVQPSHSSGRHL